MATTDTDIADPPVDVSGPAHAPAEIEGRWLAPAGRGIAIVFLALLLAILLDADSLATSIGQEPFGASRSIKLALVHPVRDISHWTGLNLPVKLVNHIFKGGHHQHPLKGAPRPHSPGRVGPPGGPQGLAAPPPATTTTTLPARRPPTPLQPLKVWMAGDSLMGTISESFSGLVKSDARFNVSNDYRIGTGLARPDVFNWPDRISQEVAAVNPDVVVLSFGANDDQDMAANGRRVALLSPEWQVEYANRINQILSVVATGNRQVIWLGMPAVRRPRLNHTKDVMNGLVKVAAATRPNVTYVDMGPVFDTPDGGYTTYLNDASGKPVAVREADGIHLTLSGANRLSPAILVPIQQLWGMTASHN
jgi:hypothetical protein